MELTKIAIKAQIDSMIKDNHGKVFIGMTHHLYGPLRGLNFILTECKSEEIMNLIDEQSVNMDADYQMKKVQEIKEGKEPKKLIDLIIKIWCDTGLSTKLMVLPYDLIGQAENPPSEVKDLNAGQKEIINVLRVIYQVQKVDPYFFRMGII